MYSTKSGKYNGASLDDIVFTIRRLKKNNPNMYFSGKLV